MTDRERQLIEKAITALTCALAHDEAAQNNADAETLAELRDHWVTDAEECVDEAMLLGLWGDDDDDFDEEDFDE